MYTRSPLGESLQLKARGLLQRVMEEPSMCFLSVKLSRLKSKINWRLISNCSRLIAINIFNLLYLYYKVIFIKTLVQYCGWQMMFYYYITGMHNHCFVGIVTFTVLLHPPDLGFGNTCAGHILICSCSYFAKNRKMKQKLINKCYGQSECHRNVATALF